MKRSSIYIAAVLLANCTGPQPFSGPVTGFAARYAQPDISYKQLYSFRGAPDGAQPLGTLVYTDGEFFGTTSLGGHPSSPCASCGTLFRISRSGQEAVIARFSGTPGGQSPEAGLTVLDGEFFGTTYLGGTGCSGASCARRKRAAPPAR